MSNNAEDPNTDTVNAGNGNDGFVWSQRLTVVAGFVIAIALAAVRFAPALAGPLEWLPK
jgi:hypothetical protein